MSNLDSQNDHVTGLLADWKNGSKEALDQLLPIVETELRRIAHNYMRRENGDHTLQTTALINEAYLKLVNQRNVEWQNRAHFYGIAAQIMRRILLNYARDRVAEKRGGEVAAQPGRIVSLEETEIVSQEKSKELIALDEALERLAMFDKTKSRIVELRYFGGLTIEETAEALGIAPITVSTNWRLAKAWLAREIRG